MTGKPSMPVWRETYLNRGLTAFALALSLGCAAPAVAQSVHGCSGLDRLPVPSVEAPDGTFFRINPDLVMDTRLDVGIIRDLASLSGALAERGTRLVYVPVPTKSLAMPDVLGDEATRYGFDVRLARALYADSISDLRRAEVTTIDAVEALVELPDERRPFFDVDHRMTNDGLAALAQAVSFELGDAYKGGTIYVTSAVAEITLHSEMLYQRQLACDGDLDPLKLQRQVTHRLPGQPEGSDAPLVVIGATVTGGDARNLSGYLAEALARPVNVEISGESAYDAMTAYLTSDAFHRARPDLIIWFVPIWEVPTRFGDQPTRELLAAARNRCEPVPNLARGEEGLEADLEGLDTSADSTLMLSSEGQTLTEASFEFASEDGRRLTRTVLRRDPELATERVFMPLSGLWSGGPDRVAIRVDAALHSPSLSMCRGG